MATEIYINNIRLDIEEDEMKVLEYNVQVHDIASVNSVNSSFTTSFDVPRTQNNVKALEGLGLASDMSRAPYTKINADLIVDGVTLIRNGWLRINKTTSTKYSLNIETGYVDFFAAVSNLIIGEDIDVSELNHNKSVQIIKENIEQTAIQRSDSYLDGDITNRNKYAYLIADHANAGYLDNRQGNNMLDSTFLVPSAEVKYIWDQIFNDVGWSYTGVIFDTNEFKRLFITYPRSIKRTLEVEEIEEQSALVYEYENNSRHQIDVPHYWFDYGMFNLNDYYTGDYLDTNILDANTSTHSPYDDDDDGNSTFNVFNVKRAGIYRITYKGSGIDTYDWTYPRQDVDDRRQWQGTSVFNLFGKKVSMDGVERSFVIDLPPDNQTFALAHDQYNQNLPEWRFNHTKMDYFQIKIEYIGGQQIAFGEAFNKFKVTDFIKEIMWRYNLTPFVDAETKNVHFMTLTERVNSDNIIDWSAKYISRNTEEYELGDYQQRNYYRWKYNDGQELLNDGYFDIENNNLKERYNLINSITYSPNNGQIEYISKLQRDGNDVADVSLSLNHYPLWVKEVKENKVDNGDTEIKVEYKELADRFYFVQATPLTSSDILGNDNIENIEYNLPYAIYSPITFQRIIFGLKINGDTCKASFVDGQTLMDKYYKDLRVITNNTRIHTISLALTSIDIANVDMTAVYYFEQEQSYYLLNSLKYSPNGEAEGEFIKITR